jgi:hypothetical protein
MLPEKDRRVQATSFFVLLLWFVGGFDALDLDGAVTQQCDDRTDCRQHRCNHRTYHSDGQGKFGDRSSSLFDDDAAHVPLMDDFLEAAEKISSFDFD